MRVALASLLSVVLASCSAGPAAPPPPTPAPAAANPSVETIASPAPASPAFTASPALSPAGAAPNVAALIAEMGQAVAVQSSGRRMETTNGAQGAVTFDQSTEARYQRPDRRHAVTTDKLAGKVTTVIEIGPTRYLQSAAGASWQVTQPAVPYKGEITVIQSFDLASLTSGVVARSACAGASCFVLTGGYDLPPGGRHTVTLTIDERSRLPLQSTTKNSYADGTSYTVIWIFADWGTPMSIEAPKV